MIFHYKSSFYHSSDKEITFDNLKSVKFQSIRIRKKKYLQKQAYQHRRFIQYYICEKLLFHILNIHILGYKLVTLYVYIIIFQ